MKKIFFSMILISVLSSQTILAKTTYYCARVDQISITEQSQSYAKYAYNSPTTQTNQGIQPALTGWGDAYKAVNMKSANWTDRSLACNYDGVTDDYKTETMVLVSNPLGDEIRCNFPDGKSFCNSADPFACPLVCDPLSET